MSLLKDILIVAAGVWFLCMFLSLVLAMVDSYYPRKWLISLAARLGWVFLMPIACMYVLCGLIFYWVGEIPGKIMGKWKA